MDVPSNPQEKQDSDTQTNTQLGLKNLYMDFWDRRNNHFYARRYLDMEFVLSVVFIIGFTQRPREKTTRTAGYILALALLRLCSSSLVTLKTLGKKMFAARKCETPDMPFLKYLEIFLDSASVLTAFLYLMHFWDTYWDGYNAPLPENEPCTGILYCSTAVVLKYYVAIGIIYYAVLFFLHILTTVVGALKEGERHRDH